MVDFMDIKELFELFIKDSEKMKLRTRQRIALTILVDLWKGDRFDVGFLWKLKKFHRHINGIENKKWDEYLKACCEKRIEMIRYGYDDEKEELSD